MVVGREYFMMKMDRHRNSLIAFVLQEQILSFSDFTAVALDVHRNSIRLGNDDCR